MLHKVLAPLVASLLLIGILASSADARSHGKSYSHSGYQQPCVPPPVCGCGNKVASHSSYNSGNDYYGTGYATQVQSHRYYSEPYSNYGNSQSHHGNGSGRHVYSNGMGSYSSYYPMSVFGR